MTAPRCWPCHAKPCLRLRIQHTLTTTCPPSGGYVLAECTGPALRQVTLLATGSEVSLAMEARAQLQKLGIATAVSSIPSFELFEQQPADYRVHVLGAGCVRIGIEAALRLGWDRYLGTVGDFVGMTGFGASAPAEQLYRHFGITAEAVVERVQQLIHQTGGDFPRPQVAYADLRAAPCTSPLPPKTPPTRMF
jgi:transketolase